MSYKLQVHAETNSLPATKCLLYPQNIVYALLPVMKTLHLDPELYLNG